MDKRKNLTPRITLLISKKKKIIMSKQQRLYWCHYLHRICEHIVSNCSRGKKRHKLYFNVPTQPGSFEAFLGLSENMVDTTITSIFCNFELPIKKTLNHLELPSSFTCNYIPFNNFNILHKCSTDIINSTTHVNRHDEQYEILSATRCLDSDIEAENNCKIFADILNCDQIPFGSKLIDGNVARHVYLVTFLGFSQGR
jgi:hypothetical protein